jgi:hypothetical protein
MHFLSVASQKYIFLANKRLPFTLSIRETAKELGEYAIRAALQHRPLNSRLFYMQVWGRNAIKLRYIKSGEYLLPLSSESFDFSPAMQQVKD